MLHRDLRDGGWPGPRLLLVVLQSVVVLVIVGFVGVIAVVIVVVVVGRRLQVMLQVGELWVVHT